MQGAMENQLYQLYCNSAYKNMQSFALMGAAERRRGSGSIVQDAVQNQLCNFCCNSSYQSMQRWARLRNAVGAAATCKTGSIAQGAGRGAAEKCRGRGCHRGALCSVGWCGRV